MKRPLLIGFVAIVSLITVLAAAPHATADEYSETQLSLVRQRCNTIRGQLQRLQVADSNARAYLGSVYLSAANDFLTPLNLRLVRNDFHAPTLIEAQASFADARTAFAAAFTVYARSLEALLRIDCYAQPARFLDQLETTRYARSAVEYTARHARGILDHHKYEVNNLMESL